RRVRQKVRLGRPPASYRPVRSALFRRPPSEPGLTLSRHPALQCQRCRLVTDWSGRAPVWSANLGTSCDANLSSPYPTVAATGSCGEMDDVLIRPPRVGDGEGIARVWLDAATYYAALDPDLFQVPSTDGLIERSEE